MILTYLASLYFVLRHEKRDVISSWGLFGLVSFALYTALLCTIWNRLQSPFLLILEPFPYLPLRLRLTEGSSRSCVLYLFFILTRCNCHPWLTKPSGSKRFFSALVSPAEKIACETRAEKASAPEGYPWLFCPKYPLRSKSTFQHLF